MQSPNFHRRELISVAVVAEASIEENLVGVDVADADEVVGIGEQDTKRLGLGPHEIREIDPRDRLSQEIKPALIGRPVGAEPE